MKYPLSALTGISPPWERKRMGCLVYKWLIIFLSICSFYSYIEYLFLSPGGEMPVRAEKGLLSFSLLWWRDVR